MELPKDALDKLKCTNCQQHLSIFPIHSHEKSQLFCGRCPLAWPDAIRQTAYETVAQFVNFPCKNQQFGCNYITTPEKMLTHEENCKFTPSECFELCNWSGLLKQFRDHYESKHMNLMITSGEDFAVGRSSKNMNTSRWFVYMEEMFLFKLESENGSLRGGVYLVDGEESCKDYLYKLSVSNTMDYFIVSPEKTVENVCSIQKTNIHFDGIDLLKFILWKIEIRNVKYPNSEHATQDGSIKKLFFCDACGKYMTPPIYSCTSGHPVCGHVFGKSVQNDYSNLIIALMCKICNVVGNVTHNKGFETIAAMIEQPCRNPGCKITPAINERETHKNTCKYQHYKCLYSNCNFSDIYYSLLNHLKNEHKNKCFINKIKAALSYTYEQKYIVLIQNDDIFVERLSVRNDSVDITVEHFGPKHRTPTFLIEINMEDNLDQRIYFKTFESISLPLKIFKTNSENWSLEINIIEHRSPAQSTNMPISSL